MVEINASGKYFKELNQQVREAVEKGEKEIVLKNVNGQYYIGDGLRGGKLHIRGDVGYRVGIHMKGNKKQTPTIVVGGSAGDFFGEYMAGGVLILLGLDTTGPLVGDYLGTGMHGGTIFIRGEVDKKLCGAEVGILDLDDDDQKVLKDALTDYCKDFGLKLEDIMAKGL